ncbi:MAG: tRNA preQ1(34) S-adenosylmethionine ribosyltransferase-isomerase QueA [Anaerolineales bacterium]
MRTSDFTYDLPADRIAQQPAEPRDSSRLLVLDREAGALAHRQFHDLPDLLRQGDLLVLNVTRVLPARVHAVKSNGGGKAEILLVRRTGPRTWEALVGGRRIVPGTRLQLRDDSWADVIEDLGGPRRTVVFDRPITPRLHEVGEAPLPPYIHSQVIDPRRYQTVYGRVDGSVAAPTAGLHFTPHLMARLNQAGVALTEITLHIGLDTFAPVEAGDPEQHTIHSEWCQVSDEAVEAIRATREKGGRVIAVGTTCVRALESAAEAHGEVGPFEGPTRLFILPGYRFRALDGLITNFHLPRSTLLMLVSAFAGRERILAAYQAALEAGYRFYSFGDAMLIL